MLSPRVIRLLRLVMPASVLCSALLACREDPVEPPPPRGSAAEVIYCAAAAPIWVAFRDGDGSWEQALPEVSGSRTAFRHVLTSERAAIASLMPGFAGEFTVLRVLYGTPAELSAEGDTTAASCVVDGGKSLRGSVSGVDMTQLAVVNVGTSVRTAVNPRLGLDFSVESVPNGPQDLLAARTTDGPSPTRLILRRDLDLPDGSLMPGLDFESSEAFDVMTANVTYENLGGDAAVNFTRLITRHGDFPIPLLPVTTTRTTQPYAGLPPGKLLAGDLQQLHVSANGTAFRTANVFFRVPVARTVRLGDPIARPSITAIASDGTLRPRARFVSQPDYDRVTSVVYQQPARPAFVLTSMTPAYAARSGGYTLDVPDLSAVAGFDASWALRPGLITTWTASRVGGTLPFGRNPVPTDGATRLTGTMQDTISLP